MRWMSKRLAAGAIVMLACGVALGLWATAASAHASLLSSTPADGSVVQNAPPEVSLQFSEHVTSATGSVRVFDGAGHQVDRGNVGHGSDDSTVTVGLKPNLAAGTYVVSWHVISADTHPVQGAFEFSIRTRSRVAADVTSKAASSSTGGKGWEAAGTVLRWITYTGAFVAAGGALFVTAVDSVDDGDRERSPNRVAVWIVGGAAIATVIGAVLQIPQTAAYDTGLGIGAVTHQGVLKEVLADGVTLTIVLLIVAAVCAVVSVARPVVASRWGAPLLAAASVALIAGGFDVSGHSRTTSPVALVAAADAIHVAAGVVWVGGLVFLPLAFRRRRAASDPIGASQVVARFSSIATVAIVALIAAGTVMTWREVRTWSALTSTGYGILVLVKVGLVAAIGAVGAYNKFRLVPVVRGKPEEGSAWRVLGRTVRTETLGVVGALVVTAVLVSAVPPHTGAAAAGGAAASTPSSNGMYMTTRQLGPSSLQFMVMPQRVGAATVDLQLIGTNGPQLAASQIKVRFDLPSKGIGPIDRAPSRISPGHYVVSPAPFTLPGTWTIEVEITYSEFDVQAAVYHVPISA